MALLALLLTVVLWGFVFWLCWWGLGQIGLPEPFHKFAVLLIVTAVIVVVIGLLMGTIPTFPILSYIGLK